MKTEQKINVESNIPLQIRIGVTGHRDIKLTDELRKSIHIALTNSVLEIINPNGENLSSPIKYIVVTPLADGADRIVAVAALQVLNAKMEVILPMLKEEYEQTFYSNDSIKEFESLLTKAESFDTLISKPLKKQFPGIEIEKCKNKAFEKNGKYIVDNCDILVAIWNGEKSESTCGTYATLTYAIKKKKKSIIISSLPHHRITINL
jgi:hypothetical protein